MHSPLELQHVEISRAFPDAAVGFWMSTATTAIISMFHLTTTMVSLVWYEMSSAWANILGRVQPAARNIATGQNSAFLMKVQTTDRLLWALFGCSPAHSGWVVLGLWVGRNLKIRHRRSKTGGARFYQLRYHHCWWWTMNSCAVNPQCRFLPVRNYWEPSKQLINSRILETMTRKIKKEKNRFGNDKHVSILWIASLPKK